MGTGLVRLLWRVILFLLLLGLLGAAEFSYRDSPVGCAKRPANGLCKFNPDP